MRRVLPLLALSLVFASCTFHSTAKQWNRRVGVDGAPVFYTATDKVGLNVLIILPFLGSTGIDSMVAELTAEVERRGGDKVTIVQGSGENYWYGFPPFTWVLTPVVSTLTAEYQPSREELIEVWMEDVRREREEAEEPELEEEELRRIATERVDAWLVEARVGQDQTRWRNGSGYGR